MFTIRAAALVAAFIIAAAPGVSSPATAADFCCASTKDIPPPPPSGRAWYLKGTLGMGTGEIGSMSNSAYAAGNYTITHKELKSSPFAGIGIGVEHSRWLRFDVTGEYRGNMAFSGQDRYRTGGNNGGNDLFGDMSAWVGLANAYIDLTTWRGITPYVGAGIGLASVEMKGFRDAGYLSGTGSSLAFGTDHSQTNFAWALYAGISYDVTPQFTMDFGYRYLDLGNVRTGVVTTVDGAASIPYHELRDVTSHDLMLSARYRLDAPSYGYAPTAMK